jgi:predicted nucleic acid-binding protein
MRILVDTNIVIPLEDSADILDSSFSLLLKLSHANMHTILIHPRTMDDLDRDKNETRKLSMLSRIEKYEMLEDVDTFSEEILSEYDISDKKDNDNVDNAILAATYNNAVHFLVTEDRGIHKKASKLNIASNVLYLQQMVDVLKRLHPTEKEVFHPNLQNLSLHKLNLKDNFFDSLKEDYDGFNDWFNSSAAEGRKAWINMDISTEQINAVLIYKSEINEIITNDNKALPSRAIKISTFKVGEQIRGRRVGELLFKTVFEYAYKNSYSWVYLTIHPEKHDFLKDMCIDLGFYSYGIDIKSNRDEVFVKQIGIQDSTPQILSSFEFYRRYSPSIQCQNVVKHIVPIKQKYHHTLFPDNQAVRSLFPEDHPSGNTLKKAYLSHAKLNQMERGDIVLFYKTGDEKRLTTIAIVEDYFISVDSDYIASKVAKRTVYSLDAIINMTQKPTKVLMFRQIAHFENKRLNYTWMIENKIIKGPIQSTTRISDTSFDIIMEKENAENCTDIN